MRNEEFSWTTNKGLNIYAKEWKTNNPQGVIGLVHGLGEHINRYNHLGSYFNQKDFAVIGFDQIGHGQSAGPRGHATDVDSLLDNVAQLLVEIELRHPDLPVFLYGHSMGGGLVLNYVLRRHPTIDGAVATSPWVDLPHPPSAGRVMLGKFMRMIYPRYAEPNGLDANHLSHDPEVVKAYLSDPLVHDQISAALGVGMMEAGQWLLNFKGTAQIPLLIMHAGEDEITSAKASEQLAGQLTGDVTWKSWNGLRHEIHNEAQQEEVFRFTYNWMQNHLNH